MARDDDQKFLCRHILFRKQVSLPKIGKALLKITADDYYKLYINGQFVAQGPAYGGYCLYQKSHFGMLRIGTNLSGVNVGV